MIRVIAALRVTLLTCAMLLPGCAAPRSEADHLATLMRRDRSLPHREAAARELGPIAAVEDQQTYRRNLHRLTWSAGEPVVLRQLAIDRLIEDDAASFRAIAERRITQVTDWPVLLHLFEHARRAPWRDFTFAAIRSYARPSRDYADADRPEHALIAALHPGRPVQSVLVDVLAGLPPGATLEHQLAAWAVLARQWTPAQQRDWLSSLPSTSALLRDLQAGAELLDALPTTQPALLWLIHLRSPAAIGLWERAAARASELSPAQRRGLALRHLPLLAQADEAWLHTSRAELWRQVHRALAHAQVVVRRDRVPAGWSEALADHGSALAWADLLTIRLLLDATREPGMVRTLFAQAEADRLDTTSEHGGVLHWRDGRLVATNFPPELRLHDRQLVASTALIEQMYTGLAHYHFHAQAHANADYAGPGTGDLAFADRFGAAAVVFTFIDQDTLNIDYHQPGNIVIDLGVVRKEWLMSD